MITDAMTQLHTVTLQARVQTIIHAWRQAQFTYYSVFGGIDRRGLHTPPEHCIPFVPPHEQFAVLKGLLEQAGSAVAFNFFST